MNAFSINPNLVVVDRNQPSLIKLLEKHGLDVIPLKLRHSKLLGGGPHCVTLDIRRRKPGTPYARYAPRRNEPPHRCVLVQAIHPLPAPKPNHST